MAAIVGSPIWENGSIGFELSKVCESYFYDSKALSADDVNGMVN